MYRIKQNLLLYIEDVLYSSIAWNYDKEIQELLDKVAAEETFLRHSEEANPSE